MTKSEIEFENTGELERLLVKCSEDKAVAVGTPLSAAVDRRRDESFFLQPRGVMGKKRLQLEKQRKQREFIFSTTCHTWGENVCWWLLPLSDKVLQTPCLLWMERHGCIAALASNGWQKRAIGSAMVPVSVKSEIWSEPQHERGIPLVG